MTTTVTVQTVPVPDTVTVFNTAPYRTSTVVSGLARELHLALETLPYLDLDGDDVEYVRDGLRRALYGLGYGLPERL